MKRLLFMLPFLFMLLVNVPIASAHARDPHPYGITINAKDTLSFTSTSAPWFSPAGLSWARLQFVVKHIETSPGIYNGWQLPDSQMATAAKNGIMVDVPLQSFPAWEIQPGCTQVPTAQAEVSYATRLFQRYGSQLRSIEVGNEEWSFESNQACKTPQNYTSILVPVVSALRSAGYTGLIGMFGYTNYDTTAQISAWFDGFNQSPSNPASLIDYYNFHFYHRGQDPDLSLTGKPALMEVVNAIHNSAVATQHGLKPIWLTEFGYTTNCDPSTCNYVTPQQQADYIQKVFDDGRNSGGVLDHAFIYTMEPTNLPFSIVQNKVFLPAYNMVKSYSAAHPTWP